MSNFSDKFKNVIGVLAPTVATALGGPFAGAAVSALANALGLKPDAQSAEVETAVLSANADALAKVKTAELAFKSHLADLGIQEEQLQYADTDSARKREMAVRDYIPGTLAIGITLGFFGVLCYMLAVGKPKEGGDALLVMLGSLGTAWASVMSYYFGSSASSKNKDTLLFQSAPAK